MFWVLTIAVSVLSSTLLIVLAARQIKSSWWVSGLLGIISVNLLLQSLPMLHGYPVADRADSMNHIGYARDIIATGGLTNLDFYPAQHILQVAIEIIGDLTSGQALSYISVLFGVLWPLGPILAAAALAGDVRAGYLGAVFAAPFVLLGYHRDPVPSALSAMLIPVVLAIYLRRNAPTASERVGTVIVQIILAFFIVYYHPVTTVYLIAVLGGFEVAAFFYSRLKRRLRLEVTPADKYAPAWGLLAIMGVTFVIWYFSFSPIQNGIGEMVHFILGAHDRQSALGEAIGQVQIASLPILELAKIAINQFGVTCAMVGLALVFLAVLVYHAIRRRQLPSRMHFAFLGAFLVAAVVMATMFLVSSAERYPVRLMRILAILSVCAVPWFGWEMFFKRPESPYWPVFGPRLRMAGIVLVSLSGFILTGMSQLNLYPNPRNGQPNEQVTYSDLSGMSWLIQNRAGDYVQAAIVPEYVPRYRAYFLGYAGQEYLGPLWWLDDIWLPTHFYGSSLMCMAQIAPGQTTYMALSDTGRIAPLRFPVSVRHMAHLYLPADWQVLAGDRTVSKLYDNGGFEIWMTNKDAPTCQ